MKKLILILSLSLILVSFVYALCEENQIDINSASLGELDEIYGIGSAKAQAIIDARPFNSINDLTKAKGIGEVTLDNITEQGLACVNEEIIEKPVNNSDENIINKTSLIKDDFVVKEKQSSKPEIIRLNNPKGIKSEDNTEKVNKSEIAKYLFVAFCVIIGILLILKNRKNKNEII